MRVRGMWGIENPWNVFGYVYKRNPQKKFNLMCIINNAKGGSFDNTGELVALSRVNSDLSICDIKVKNPDNPAQLVGAKLIAFSI